MANFTLDDLRAAAEREYGDTTIEIPGEEPVVLLNALRLSKADRKQIVDLQARLGSAEEEGSDIDEVEVVSDLIRVAAKGNSGQRLLDAVDGDLTVLIKILEAYGEETELGEASPSQD